MAKLVIHVTKSGRRYFVVNGRKIYINSDMTKSQISAIYKLLLKSVNRTKNVKRPATNKAVTARATVNIHNAPPARRRQRSKSKSAVVSSIDPANRVTVSGESRHPKDSGLEDVINSLINENNKMKYLLLTYQPPGQPDNRPPAQPDNQPNIPHPPPGPSPRQIAQMQGYLPIVGPDFHFPPPGRPRSPPRPSRSKARPRNIFSPTFAGEEPVIQIGPRSDFLIPEGDPEGNIRRGIEAYMPIPEVEEEYETKQARFAAERAHRTQKRKEKEREQFSEAFKKDEEKLRDLDIFAPYINDAVVKSEQDSQDPVAASQLQSIADDMMENLKRKQKMIDKLKKSLGNASAIAKSSLAALERGSSANPFQAEDLGGNRLRISQDPEAKQDPIIKEGEGKGDQERGLYNDEINKVMSRHKEYLGTIMSDQIKTLLPDIKPQSRICFIINTDPSSKPGSHWQSILIDARPGPESSNSLEFMDTFGRSIPPHLLEDLKIVVRMLNPHTLLKIKENRIIMQKDNSSNCGYFAILFLIDRLRGKSFSEATGYDDQQKINHAAHDEKEIERLKNMKPFSYI